MHHGIHLLISILRVAAHLEPLAIATNVLQMSRARMDHVLLLLANLYHTYKGDGMEPDVQAHMLSRLELRWKNGADQDLFILATILNPYIRRTIFNREVLSNQDIENMAKRTFKRLFLHEPDPSFSEALQDYLEGEGDYSAASMDLDSQEKHAREKGQVITTYPVWACRH